MLAAQYEQVAFAKTPPREGDLLQVYRFEPTSSNRAVTSDECGVQSIEEFAFSYDAALYRDGKRLSSSTGREHAEVWYVRRGSDAVNRSLTAALETMYAQLFIEGTAVVDNDLD